MVQINFALREINCKIVYYGPGRCGKTTNLQVVHKKAPQNSTGELVSIATETDRTSVAWRKANAVVANRVNAAMASRTASVG